MPLSFDPDGTKVVLICTTNCHLDSENLPPIPSVENNVRTLGKIFRRRDIIGLKGSCVTEIVDPSSSTNLLIQLSKLSKQATDTFCVYYAGHGIKSPFVSGLFLATTETTLEECHLNGVEFNKIRQIVFDSPAAKKLLLFDCCYSGEVATEEMGGAISNVLSSSLQIKGTYSIASTPRNSVAYAPEEEMYTAFTKELVDVLEVGVDEDSEFLTLNRIYEEIRARISKNPRLPLPQRRVELDAQEFVFARNRKWNPHDQKDNSEIVSARWLPWYGRVGRTTR